MEGEIAVIHERVEHGLRERADPHLHRGAVGHHRGDVASDGALHGADDRWRVRRQRLRSEEHTSELQSQSNLVCRRLPEKNKAHKDVTNEPRTFNPSVNPQLKLTLGFFVSPKSL